MSLLRIYVTSIKQFWYKLVLFEILQALKLKSNYNNNKTFPTEHNGGGLPFWLYQMYPNITLRSSDSNFMEYVDKWWSVLLPLIRPQLYINGGIESKN